LRNVANRLRVSGHLEVAADDGEIGLAFAEQRGTCGGAIGLHRAQPYQAVGLVVERLRQRLNHLEIIAVGWPDRDPEGHRPHREIVRSRQGADDGQYAGQHHEGRPPSHRTGRGRGDRFGWLRAVGHRFSGNGSRSNFNGQRALRRYCSKFLAEPGLQLRHG